MARRSAGGSARHRSGAGETGGAGAAGYGWGAGARRRGTPLVSRARAQAAKREPATGHTHSASRHWLSVAPLRGAQAGTGMATVPGARPSARARPGGAHRSGVDQQEEGRRPPDREAARLSGALRANLGLLGAPDSSPVVRSPTKSTQRGRGCHFERLATPQASQPASS